MYTINDSMGNRRKTQDLDIVSKALVKSIPTRIPGRFCVLRCWIVSSVMLRIVAMFRPFMKPHWSLDMSLASEALIFIAKVLARI